MAQSQDRGSELVALSDMKLRPVGGSAIGVTIDRSALEEYDLVDENGELKSELWVRQYAYEDGTVELQLKDE